MTSSNYESIGNFCPLKHVNAWVDDPLSYCLIDTADNQFMHGSSAANIRPQDMKCQAYMAKRCAKNWDKFCEFRSTDPDTRYPNSLSPYQLKPGQTQGDFLIINTARSKYNINTSCPIRKEIFDPTVVSSPDIEYTDPGCTYMFAVQNPSEVDNDPVMNKMLERPDLDMNFFVNMYNTMYRMGTLNSLRNTKLGGFFDMNKAFFEARR